MIQNPADLLPIVVEVPQNEVKEKPQPQRERLFKQRNLGTFKREEELRIAPTPIHENA